MRMGNVDDDLQSGSKQIICALKPIDSDYSHVSPGFPRYG